MKTRGIITLLAMIILESNAAAKLTNVNGLRVGLATDRKLTGHPIFDSHRLSNEVRNIIYGPIFKFNEAWEPVCNICESQPSLQNEQVQISRAKSGVGKLSIEIRLRKDAKWADGVSISGHDIAFSWELGKAHSKTSKLPMIYDRITAVEVPRGKPHIAKILLKGAFFQNKMLDEFTIIPRHIEEPIWQSSQKKVKKYLARSNYKVDPENPGLYYHNYYPRKIARSQLKLTKNRFYPQDEIYYGMITITKFKDLKAWNFSVTETKNASDVFINENLNNPNFKADAKILSQSPKMKNSRIYSAPSMYWEQAVFNQRNPILSDKKIRQAIIYAINWQMIAKTVGPNNMMTSPTFEAPFSPFYSPLDPYEYSPSKAKKLIKAAGWLKAKGKEYFVKGKDKLEFNMVVQQNNAVRLKIAKIIEKNLNDIGIVAKLYPKSRSFLLKRVIKEGRFTGLAFYGIKMGMNSSPRSLFHSQEIPSSLNDYLGQNVGVWYSKDVDVTLDNLRLSISRTKRNKNISKLQQHYAKDLPGISLFFHKNINVIPKNIDIGSPPPGGSILSSVHEWSPKNQ